MALNLVSPGVKVREVDLTVGRIDSASSIVGAIAGPFQKGPVNEPTLVETEQDLLKYFGKPLESDGQYEYWLTASSYLSYGGVLRVVRTSSASLNNSNSAVGGGSTTLKIDSYEDYLNNHSSDSAWNWAAKNPGSWANNLKVCVIDNFADQTISGISTNLSTESNIDLLFSATGNVEPFDTSITGISTSGIQVGQVVTAAILPDPLVTPATVLAVGVGTVFISIPTTNSGSQSSVVFNFNEVVTNTVGSDIQVGYAITQALNKSVAVGSSVVTYNGYLRGLITGIGDGELYVRVTDRVDSDGVSHSVSYKNPGSGTNVFSFDAPSALKPITVVTNAGVTTNTYTSGSRADWYDNQTLGLTNTTVFWKSIANKPGTSQYALERNSSNDEIHVVVVDDLGTVTGVAGNIIEKFAGLSKATDAKISPSENIYYKDFISDNSQYIFAGIAPTGSISKLVPNPSNSNQYTTGGDNWASEAQGLSFKSLGRRTYSLVGGQDYSGSGQQVSLSDILASYDLFKNSSEYDIDFIISGPSGGSTVFESQAKANALIAIAEERKDCIACISPHKSGVVNQSNTTTQTNSIVEFFDPLDSSSYAVFDSGYKYTFDRFNNKFVYVPCNGDVAGLMARTSIDNYPWFSPAGATRGSLNNTIKLAYNPTQSQRDQLYTKRINPIIASPGSGFILFGDKTALGYPSAFDRINVRKLFLTIERTIEKAARSQLFEFNDIITRTNFLNIVEPYLRDVRAKRGISEFVVICDETNNTSDVIDSNQFKADIFVKPTRSINFIGLTFVATRTGISFSEVVGTV
jgi:hypothetical protein